jgi:hypothetical protein
MYRACRITRRPVQVPTYPATTLASENNKIPIQDLCSPLFGWEYVRTQDSRKSGFAAAGNAETLGVESVAACYNRAPLCCEWSADLSGPFGPFAENKPFEATNAD